MDNPLGWEAAGPGRGDLVLDGNEPVCGQRTPTVSFEFCQRSWKYPGSVSFLSWMCTCVSVDGLSFVFDGTQVVFK